MEQRAWSVECGSEGMEQRETGNEWQFCHPCRGLHSFFSGYLFTILSSRSGGWNIGIGVLDILKRFLYHLEKARKYRQPLIMMEQPRQGRQYGNIPTIPYRLSHGSGDRFLSGNAVSANRRVYHPCRGFHPFSCWVLLPYCRPAPGAGTYLSGIWIFSKRLL